MNEETIKKSVMKFRTPNGEYYFLFEEATPNPLNVKLVLRVLQLKQDNQFYQVGLFPLQVLK